MKIIPFDFASTLNNTITALAMGTVSYAGALHSLLPEGMTPSAIAAAAGGAFVYVLSTSGELKGKSIAQHLLSTISIFMVCFLTGFFLATSLVSSNFPIIGQTYEAAAFSGAVGGVGIIATLQRIGKFISRKLDFDISINKKDENKD